MTWNEVLDASECTVQWGGPDFLMSATCTPFSNDHGHCPMAATTDGRARADGREVREGGRGGAHFHKQVGQFLCYFCESRKV